MVDQSLLTQAEINKLPNADLSDRLGLIKASLAPLLLVEEMLKERMIKKTGKKDFMAFDGKLYRSTVTKAEVNTLSKDKAKQYLTPKQIKDCTVESSRTTVNCRAQVKPENKKKSK